MDAICFWLIMLNYIGEVTEERGNIYFLLIYVLIDLSIIYYYFYFHFKLVGSFIYHNSVYSIVTSKQIKESESESESKSETLLQNATIKY